MSSTHSSAGGPAEGPNPDAPAHEALPGGARLGDFEIIRTIGSGGFGTVYLAMDRSLDREVAIKEFLPTQLACRRPNSQEVTLRSQSCEANYCAGLRSFVNEAKILAHFNHPGIVKVHRFWEGNGTAYMVMPYLRGPTLRDVRRSMKEPPTEAWLRGVLDPLLDALAMLHAEGIYHRDIAPDNILLPSPREPVLLDFGAARRVIGDRTQTLTAVLKPSYAPIEQYAEATQLRQGPWTDLYALGAVVVYMLNSVPPPPSTVRSMHDEIPRLLAEPPAGVSASFLAAVQWALCVRPQDRPQSVQQFRNALDGRIVVPPLPQQPKLIHGEEPAYKGASAMNAHLPWQQPQDVQPTTVAVAMHADQPSFEKPEGVTWDTTMQLASDTPQPVDAASSARTAASHAESPTAQPLSEALQARLARLRQNAIRWPRSALVVAGAAAVVVSGAAFSLLHNRLPEPSAATWHEIGKHAKNEVIIEERESDSRPVPPLMSPVTPLTPDPQPVVQTARATLAEAPVQMAAAAPAETSPIARIATPLATTAATTATAAPISTTDTAEIKSVAVNEVSAGSGESVVTDRGHDRRFTAKKPSRPRLAAKQLHAAPSPREACGDRNFFSMAICINRKCDEPLYRRHPQCVALLQQREDNARRWQH